jgi:hypothetical protein
MMAVCVSFKCDSAARALRNERQRQSRVKEEDKARTVQAERHLMIPREGGVCNRRKTSQNQRSVSTFEIRIHCPKLTLNTVDMQILWTI